MSYGTNKHNVFSDRCKNFATAIQNLREEADRLDEIYINETASGTDPAFVSNANATKQEHIDMILLMRDLKLFMENGAVATTDRQQWITPFLANG